MVILRKGAFIFFILFIAINTLGQSKKKQKSIVVTDKKSKWIDSVYNGLTEEERIGQIFMVAAILLAGIVADVRFHLLSY